MPSLLFALTPREIEVLTLSAQGKTAAETAKGLGIVERTANAHKQAIIRKLNASNITHAVAVALKDGIIKFP